MTASYFLDEPKSWRKIPGGGFRSALMNGIIAGHHVGPDGEFVYHYMRAIPFIPPLSFLPSVIVATNEFKTSAEEDAVSGLRFRPVILARLIRLEWRHWTNQSWIYPDDLIPDCDGEPGDYLLRAPADLQVPASETHFWAMECMGRDPKADEPPHFFSHEPRCSWAASERGRDWMEKRWKDAADFRSVEIA